MQKQLILFTTLLTATRPITGTQKQLPDQQQKTVVTAQRLTTQKQQVIRIEQATAKPTSLPKQPTQDPRSLCEEFIIAYGTVTGLAFMSLLAASWGLC